MAGDHDDIPPGQPGQYAIVASHEDENAPARKRWRTTVLAGREVNVDMERVLEIYENNNNGPIIVD